MHAVDRENYRKKIGGVWSLSGTNSDASKSAQMVGSAPNTFHITFIFFWDFACSRLRKTLNVHETRTKNNKNKTNKQTNKCTSNINKKTEVNFNMFLLPDLPGRSLYSRSEMSIYCYSVKSARTSQLCSQTCFCFFFSFFFFFNLVLSGWLLDLLQVTRFSVGDARDVYLVNRRDVEMIAKRGPSLGFLRKQRNERLVPRLVSCQNGSGFFFP